MRNKRFRKKSGFILLPVILAMFIVGLLGVGLASMYSGTFSTLQAGQAASQAKQFASIEAAAIKARGYDDAESGAHGWQDMTSLVGSEDGSKWQSKVETMRTDTTPDGNNVKVMKVSTRKNGELVSRYSEEIPVVEGLDVYSKDEIDSMFSTVDHQIGTLTTDLTNLTTRMTNAESSITNLSGDINTINSNIDSINADLDTLQKMINANTSLINEETSYRKTADTNLQNNINKEANARTSAVNAINLQINSLKSTLSNLQGALTSEANARKASDSTLQSNINSEASARAKAIQDLAAEVNNKYTELKNLYDGIKGRLDGKEFVRSKDAANNISLKYEQLAGEDKKSIHAYVDGNLVPLASQNGDGGKDGNVIPEEKIILEFDIEIGEHGVALGPMGPGAMEYVTTDKVYVYLYKNIDVYLDTPDAKVLLGNTKVPLDSTTTSLGAGLGFGCIVDPTLCENESVDYVKQHLDEFKSKIAQEIPEYYKATNIKVTTHIINNG